MSMKKPPCGGASCLPDLLFYQICLALFRQRIPNRLSAFLKAINDVLFLICALAFGDVQKIDR